MYDECCVEEEKRNPARERAAMLMSKFDSVWWKLRDHTSDDKCDEVLFNLFKKVSSFPDVTAAIEYLIDVLSKVEKEKLKDVEEDAKEGLFDSEDFLSLMPAGDGPTDGE